MMEGWGILNGDSPWFDFAPTNHLVVTHNYINISDIINHLPNDNINTNSV